LLAGYAFGKRQYKEMYKNDIGAMRQELIDMGLITKTVSCPSNPECEDIVRQEHFHKNYYHQKRFDLK
jgi:hypothetical protein